MPVDFQYKHVDLTRKIIGCAMKVHSYFGPGFLETVYHRSLLIEFDKEGLHARSEVEEIVKYYNEIVGKRRIDLIVEGRVIVELKAVVELDTGSYNQVLNCLNIFNFEVGLLLNFGKNSLQFKRFVRSLKEKE